MQHIITINWYIQSEMFFFQNVIELFRVLKLIYLFDVEMKSNINPWKIAYNISQYWSFLWENFRRGNIHPQVHVV